MYRWVLFLISCHQMWQGCHSPVDGHLLQELSAEQHISALDQGLTDLLFTWEDLDSNVVGHQILVASDSDLLRHNTPDLWNSGLVYSDQDTMRYAGRPILGMDKVWWKIRTLAADGKESDYTRAQSLDVASGTAPRITLVGGTLISSMERYGFFECAVLNHWPKVQPTFRNIGWPADDVFGLARSQFGSAQNTRSWKPPTAEEGFGSKVLMEHIGQSDPTTLINGYGPEVAYAEDEEDIALFKSGYTRLCDFADSMGLHLILLTPPKQEKHLIDEQLWKHRNHNLMQASDFIREMAVDRGYVCIDLFEQLIPTGAEKRLTENGVQLSIDGYQVLCDLLLQELGVPTLEPFALSLTKVGLVERKKNIEIFNWVSTVRGVRFDAAYSALNSGGSYHADAPTAVYINGNFYAKGPGKATIKMVHDSIRSADLKSAIWEKNRLHRYQLRPLNEAYIYLFRRHEMGHLAYEMEDFARLVTEKEAEIGLLLNPQRHRFEIELVRPWKSPKDYPEDEVPAFVPEPNIANELKSFTLSDDLEINLFAADPMIANPININWDTKGRAWVATSSTYPHIVPGKEPNDRIVILEDIDQDGRADTSIVFADGFLVPHSVMPIPGGAYVTSTTEFLHLVDKDGDDVADERRVLYSGFGNADVHHMIHGLRWAPWGDLHFMQSIYINTFVETPYGIRVLNGSGTWKFRPETERLEIFSTGLINPWGEAFDQWGQSFATDGAAGSGISYLFPGAAHQTAVGAERVVQGLNYDTPKNTGAEIIYSRHLPQSWQGSIITSDFRANRTVRYEIEPKGSGYTAREVETILRSDHRAYRPVDMKVGPDGALYVVDWYNPIIDHGEVDFHHPIRDRSHGRIWRITNRRKPILKIPVIRGASLPKLLNLLKSPEQHTRMQANRELVARKCPPEQVLNWARSLSSSSPRFEHHRLEGLWLMAALGSYDQDLLRSCLQATNGNARAAAVRQITHFQKQDEGIAELSQLINDRHPQVRLEAIHALREWNTDQAADLVVQALDHPLDANLEYAIWHTIGTLKDKWLPDLLDGKQVFAGNVNKQMFALLACNEQHSVPQIAKLVVDIDLVDSLRDHAWHTMARLGDAKVLTKVLDRVASEKDGDLLRSLAEAPASNSAVPDQLQPLDQLIDADAPTLRLAAIKLVGRWKVSDLSAALQSKLVDVDVSPQERLVSAAALVQLDGLKDLRKVVKSTSYKPAIRATAAMIWAQEEPAAAADDVITLFQDLDDEELAERLFVTYRSMEEGPKILSQALAGEKIPESIASIGIRVTQTSGLDLSELQEVIRNAGDIQPLGAELTAQEKNNLLEEAATNGSFSRGKAVYRQPQLLCATCHRVQGFGGLIGPDLTSVGAYMTPNSILESLLNPSKDIKQGYETVILTRKDGEILSGTLYRKTNNATLLKVANGDILEIPASEIDKIDVSPVSLMPAGLTASLHRDELRDLLTYLTNLGVEQ
ncbi:MAG: hypothetical protein HKN87_02025 [Saprospiraceae bacterium]|nr:hypothetical protein [Saprospiraceae bacterium]